MDAVQPVTREIVRRRTMKAVPPLADIDGRSRLARAHREAVKHIHALLEQPRPRLKLAERAAISRCTWLQVLSDEAAARALAGTIPVSDATRAAGQAERSLERLLYRLDG